MSKATPNKTNPPASRSTASTKRSRTPSIISRSAKLTGSGAVIGALQQAGIDKSLTTILTCITPALVELCVYVYSIIVIWINEILDERKARSIQKKENRERASKLLSLKNELQQFLEDPNVSEEEKNKAKVKYQSRIVNDFDGQLDRFSSNVDATEAASLQSKDPPQQSSTE